MNRSELEHIIRAACAITNQENVVIIGSQAILASFDYSVLPEDTTLSVEADVFFLDDEDGSLSDLVDGTIGELSPFQFTHGIYAHGVGENTAILPDGWKERLLVLRNANTEYSSGLCLDPYDLCVAKLFAYRENDLSYVRSLLDAGLIKLPELRQRVDLVIITPELEDRARVVVAYLAKFGDGTGLFIKTI